ncbi:MAG: SDR family oxidoreductase [Pseudonocardia sp.]
MRNLSLGRLGTPGDVARVIVFLLSPASAQITGSEYPVDGGALHEIWMSINRTSQSPRRPACG